MVNLILKVKSGMIVVIVFMDEGKLFLRENKMTKEDYLQMKKQARVWFTVNIIISLIAIAGGILVVISKSRHIPFLLMALGALTLMNQVLVTPAFNAKRS